MSALLATIPPPPGNTIEIGPLTVHYYGVAIAIGVLVAITLTRRRYAAMGGDADIVDRVGLWAVLFGLVGARVGYLIPRLGEFADRPLQVFAIWEGGLVYFGGLSVGALAALYFLRRNRGDVPAFLEAIAPAIPLAQAFGRWGNYFNQELYGTPTDLPWALEIERGGEIVATVHPTFLYESLYNLLLAGFLVWLGSRRVLRRGGLIFVYAMGYGVARFLLELIRTDTTFRVFGLSRNAYVSIVVLLIGVVGLWWWQRRPVPELATPEDEAPEDEAPEPADDADEVRPEP
jgi:prolipoprotein diacylglyceryl transferase